MPSGAVPCCFATGQAVPWPLSALAFLCALLYAVRYVGCVLLSHA